MQMKGSLCPISFLLYDPATAVGTLDQLSLANRKFVDGKSHELGTRDDQGPITIRGMILVGHCF